MRAGGGLIMRSSDRSDRDKDPFHSEFYSDEAGEDQQSGMG